MEDWVKDLLARLEQRVVALENEVRGLRRIVALAQPDVRRVIPEIPKSEPVKSIENASAPAWVEWNSAVSELPFGAVVQVVYSDRVVTGKLQGRNQTKDTPRSGVLTIVEDNPGSSRAGDMRSPGESWNFGEGYYNKLLVRSDWLPSGAVKPSETVPTAEDAGGTWVPVTSLPPIGTKLRYLFEPGSGRTGDVQGVKIACPEEWLGEDIENCLWFRTDQGDGPWQIGADPVRWEKSMKMFVPAPTPVPDPPGSVVPRRPTITPDPAPSEKQSPGKSAAYRPRGGSTPYSPGYPRVTPGGRKPV